MIKKFRLFLSSPYASYLFLSLFILLILFAPSVVSASTILSPRSSLDNYTNSGYFDFTGISSEDQRPQESWTYYSSLATLRGYKLYGLKATFNYTLQDKHSYDFTIAIDNFNLYGFTMNEAYICTGSSWSSTNKCYSSTGISYTSSTITYSFYIATGGSYFNFFIGPLNSNDQPLSLTYAFRLNSFSIDDITSIPPDATNNDVINNSNQNTANIIDNSIDNTNRLVGSIVEWNQRGINVDNENTQSIINNSNQNTQMIIDSNKSCSFVDKSGVDSVGYYLSSNGSSVSDSSNQWGITKYYNILGSTIKVIEPMVSGAYTCFYDSNKTLISCISQGTFNLNDLITIPSKAKYVRFSIYITSNIPIFEICTNGSQAIVNSITDDSDINGNSIVEDLQGIGVGSGPISSLVTLPITLLDKFEDGISSSCSAFPLGNLLGTNLSLPCIDIPSLIGQNLWIIIDAITSIFMIYNIVMLIIRYFDHFTSLQDDFDILYMPEDEYGNRLIKKRGYAYHGQE